MVKKEQSRREPEWGVGTTHDEFFYCEQRKCVYDKMKDMFHEGIGEKT